MDYKKAIEVLINLLKKESLTSQEKEALAAAIGALDCAALADSKFKGYLDLKKPSAIGAEKYKNHKG